MTVHRGGRKRPLTKLQLRRQDFDARAAKMTPAERASVKRPGSSNDHKQA